MFEMERVASAEAKTFMNSKRDITESLMVGDTTMIGETDLALGNQNQDDKVGGGEYLDMQSPVLSYNTRLDAKDEILANITASCFDRTNTTVVGWVYVTYFKTSTLTSKATWP